jgi:hypothetical protein
MNKEKCVADTCSLLSSSFHRNFDLEKLGSKNDKFRYWKIHYWQSEFAEAICLVRCLGRSQLISSLSPLVNKLFGGILSWAQTLIRSFTERQLSHKVHAYLVHNLCLTCSQGTKNTKKKFMPILFQTCV